MLQVSKLLPQGQGLAPVLLKRATTVELDWDVRQKSRFAATDSAGRELGIFLPRGTLVRGGDVLVAEDGSMVRVIAALQPDHLKIEPDHVLADMLRAMHLIVTEQNMAFEPEGGAYAAGHGGGHSHGGHGHGDDHHHGHGQGHSHDHDHTHDHGHTHEHSHAAAPATAPARGRTVSIPVVAQGHVHGPGCNHAH